MTDTETIRIRFSGDFGTGLEFVEVENTDGASISVGEWTKDGEYHILEIEGVNT